MKEAAILIESLGYDTIWLPEHVVEFESLASTHPYVGDRYPHKVDQARTDWRQALGQFDPPVVAAAIGMVTSVIRMGTYVNILGQRNPVLFARELATLDHLTMGRFNFGVGTGWVRQEYEALGVSFEHRGERMDEYIRAMKELWTCEHSEFHGEFVDFPPLLAYPKPLQKPHPPILVGGQSKRGIRRAAELGDGLIVFNLDLPEVELCLEEFEEALKREGRGLEDVQVVIGLRNVAQDAFSDDGGGKPVDETKLRQTWEQDATFLEGCRKIGAITEAVCFPKLPTDGYAELMNEYAATIGLEPRSCDTRTLANGS